MGRGVARFLGHMEFGMLGPSEKGTGDMELGAGGEARLDLLLELQVRIRLDAARRTHGRDAVRQIEARRREGHLQPEARAVEVPVGFDRPGLRLQMTLDRKSTRLNSSHQITSYALFFFKKKTNY